MGSVARRFVPLPKQNQQQTQEHVELLSEMYAVVFMKDPEEEREDFLDWVDTLNQGASLEGIYNAFTHSSSSRKLESSSPSASPHALKVFGIELARLEMELPRATFFDEGSAGPLAEFSMQASDEEAPGRVSEGGVQVVQYGERTQISYKDWEKARKSLLTPSTPSSPQLLADFADRYSRLFVSATIFTLKRILSDEALKVAELKAEYPEKLALWYSKWVIQMTGYKVDFGLKLRNDTREQVHYEWALKVPADRLRWEVLNRIHRLLNHCQTN